MTTLSVTRDLAAITRFMDRSRADRFSAPAEPAGLIGDEPDEFARRYHARCALCHGHRTVTVSPVHNTPCPRCTGGRP